MTPPESTAVAVELERLRGTVEAGFAQVEGALALLGQRNDQTDRQLADHEQRLDAIERNRWPVQAVTALTAVGALVLTVWQSSGR
ncbi:MULTISPECIES: hypothetical protein [unclassified Streptomyces]|uniref:hypothetical protein n=1 Tax=unclassified Streptomyces TaxID=2593676 RepID=UPI00070B73E8|nr:hypothetical protein [Streptomyces sp. Root1310]KQX83479.1 hypothetical protein ASD48_03290 [Streptomyces sp. Root1310]